MIASILILFSFAPNKLGLATQPDEVRSAVQFVPNKIYGLLRTAVSKLTLPGTPSGELYKGALTKVLDIGTDYRLWEARDEKGGAHVKVAKKNAQGTFVLFAELKQNSFANNAQAPNATTNIANLIAASKAYAAELDADRRWRDAAEGRKRGREYFSLSRH